jgi:hypothetical protein
LVADQLCDQKIIMKENTGLIQEKLGWRPTLVPGHADTLSIKINCCYLSYGMAAQND